MKVITASDGAAGLHFEWKIERILSIDDRRLQEPAVAGAAGVQAIQTGHTLVIVNLPDASTVPAAFCGGRPPAGIRWREVDADPRQIGGLCLVP